MATLNNAQIQQAWIQAGGNPQYAAQAAAIAMAESGGNTSATNRNTNGSTDIGLFQINTVHGGQATTDITGNIRAAIQISANGSNWAPWCTAYTDNACGTKGGKLDPGRLIGQPGSAAGTGNGSAAASGTGGAGSGMTSSQFSAMFGQLVKALFGNQTPAAAPPNAAPGAGTNMANGTTPAQGLGPSGGSAGALQ